MAYGQAKSVGIGYLASFPWQLLATTPPATTNTATVTLAWTGSSGFFRAGDADTDTDGDGLPDARETLLNGTEPDEADTDGDRLPDGWEIAYGLDPFAEDSLADPDNDRVPTLYEYYHGANPTNADNPVDADLVNCAWDESFTHSNAEAFVRLEQSVAYHISLTNCLVPRVLDWFPPDTQSDLIVTNANLAMGGHLRSGSPAIDAGFAAAPRLDFEGQARDSAPDIGADEYAGFAGGDSDGDGLGDAAEVEVYGTNPKDYDGMSDFWEARHGLSWTNAADACQNPDGDGLVNLHEYWCQTDPSAADGAQYALSAAALAIDSRIAERNPTNALPLFENYLANGANGVFIRNTNCWAADLDLTCCSPWNSYLGNRIDNGDREIATKAARLFSWFAVGSTGASGNRGCAVWSSACPANLRLLVRLVQGVSAAGRAGWDEATPITPRRAGAPRSDRAARAC